MKSAVETLSPTRVKMTVEVPYEELKPSVDAAFKAIGAQINIPGFRPGKVPTRIIEQRVGRGAVLQEAVNQALPDFYTQALVENDINPLGQPEVDITEVPITTAQQFVFTAELDVRPAIELPDFSSVSVTVDAVDEATVRDSADEQLQTLRERFGTLAGVERPAGTGDFVTIDLRGTIGGEEIDAVQGVSYEIGSGSMVEGLDEALEGLSAGDSKTFTAPLAGGDRIGEESEITVTLTAVKERELPELDDDFAQEASEFETLDELLASLRVRASQTHALQQGMQARDKMIEHLLETLPIPVPDSLIEAEVHRHLEEEQRLEDDEHRAEVTEEATKSIRTQLLLDAIAEQEQVDVTQEELIEYLLMTAQQYGMDPGDFARAIDEGNQVSGMAAEVARRKALAAVLERVSVLDPEGNVVDINASLETESSEEDDAEGDEATSDDIEVAEVVSEDAATEEAVDDEQAEGETAAAAETETSDEEQAKADA